MTTPKKTQAEAPAPDPSDPVAVDEDPVAQPPGEGATEPAEPSPEKEVARWRDLALRSQADLDNYRKRMAREKADAIKFANVGLLDQLLPVLDNFYLGLEAARTDDDATSSTIYQGMSMVLKQIEDFLREQGVETVETADAEFDPNLHEAIGYEHSPAVPEGKIITELRKGYRLKDRLLRAANVIVSKGPA